MPPDLRQREFHRILLVKPTALGDVVHTIPVLVKLRRRYPQARIDWLVTPENAEVVQAHPALSHVVLFDRRGFKRQWFKALGQTLRMLWRLRRARYDLVVDLHGQLRTAVFTRITGAPVRIGFDRPRRRGVGEGDAPAHGWAGAREGAWRAYTHRLPIRTLQVHAVDRYLWVGDWLGFDNIPVAPAVRLAPAAEEAAERLLAPVRGRTLVALAPGTMWETKHWRIEGFAEVAGKLAARGFAVAITGTAGEMALAAAILAVAPGALNLCGQTSPGVLAAVLGRAALCITNDSGAMHLAVAMGSRAVAIFGPTDPMQVGPYGQGERVVRAGVECSPCNLRRLSQCPHGHACMHLVGAATVLERVDAALQEMLPGQPAKARAAAIPSKDPNV